MIQGLVFAVVLVGGTLVVFVVSIRIGILLGLRLDRALEARAAAGEAGPIEEIRADE
jgi:hypothetical protein